MSSFLQGVVVAVVVVVVVVRVFSLLVFVVACGLFPRYARVACTGLAGETGVVGLCWGVVLWGERPDQLLHGHHERKENAKSVTPWSPRQK